MAGGGGGGGGPERLLPGDRLADDVRTAIVLSIVGSKAPVSFADLERDGLIGSGWEHFDVRERAVAEWLHSNDVEVRSVAASRIPGRATPDGTVMSETVEFKTLQRRTVEAVRRNLRDSRRQSRRVVIDGRTAGLDEATAVAGLVDGLRRGGDIDEVVLLLRDGRALHWP